MSKTIIDVRIVSADLDPQTEDRVFAVRHRAAGAVVTFVGRVRDEGGRVDEVRLEHYPGFTEREIAKIAAAACERWPLQGVAIAHRVGALAPGEAIVFLAVAAAHRRPAFEAADYLMDYLKSEAPLWKKEVSGGESRWIEPRAEDYADKARWRVND